MHGSCVSTLVTVLFAIRGGGVIHTNTPNPKKTSNTATPAFLRQDHDFERLGFDFWRFFTSGSNHKTRRAPSGQEFLSSDASRRIQNTDLHCRDDEIEPH